MSLFEQYLKKVGEVGHVKSINSVLVNCTGLLGARIGEKVVFESDQVGFVYSISSDETQVLIFDTKPADLGSMVARTGETLMVAATEEAMGRVLDPFGNPIDNKGKFRKASARYLESPAPAMIDRVRINENLETGVTVVDLLVPIGKGQRQLIIGDQKTGKTSVLVQAIARQAQLGTICIYCSIGKKKADLTATLDKLEKVGARDKTIIIAAPASIATSLIYLAPFCAFSVAEYFREKGKNVLIVLDEISRHARYYRELSILANRMPGRDGYPGDIFYLHSHLMERAGRFTTGQASAEKEKTLTLKIEEETASITVLPVVETLGGDFTGYVQTNLMSMTDGHLFFDMNQYQQGQRPAINIGLSVTRTGKQTQKTVERDIALKVREVLFEYTKARDVAKFGVELLVATQQKVLQGERLMAIFDQPSTMIVPKVIQLLFVEMLLSGFWSAAGPADIKVHKEKILDAYNKKKLDDLVKALLLCMDLGSEKRFVENVSKWSVELNKICESK